MPISKEQAWEFFSNPSNLEAITPEDMAFKVTSEVPEEIYPGLIITYIITPVLGIRMKWCTEITHVKAGEYFVDEQRIGPYRLWHHEHHFTEVAGGVEMTDILTYSVGWGWIGKLADGWFVRRKVMQIFSFRETALRGRFGSS
ncbi:MAG: SRPBCC family protein [Bacteroidota bacterium]